MPNYIINYEQCWSDLKNNLKKYMRDKGMDYLSFDGVKPIGRYCISLSLNDIFDLMDSIEKNNKKYL